MLPEGETSISLLDTLEEWNAYPKTIRGDQASGFISRDLDLWAYQRGVDLDFSRPGKPTDNAFIESFIGKFRTDCLNAHGFLMLADARSKWRNGVRTTTMSDRTAQPATSRRYRS